MLKSIWDVIELVAGREVNSRLGQLKLDTIERKFRLSNAELRLKEQEASRREGAGSGFPAADGP